jgi:6,7-dimethyl-8-ribityllumazine synthase
MFCALENLIGHRDTEATEEHKSRSHALVRSLCSLCLCGQPIRGADRFTQLDAALRHLTLLDLFSDSAKRTHGDRGTPNASKYAKRTHRDRNAWKHHAGQGLRGKRSLARRIGGLTLLAMSTHAPAFRPGDVPKDARLAILAARFNAHIVDELLAGCERRLAELGIDKNRVVVHRVPGAFELPVAAKMLIETEQFAAVICLGCVIRGDTPHFEYVAGEAARGIQQVAIDSGVPVIFGVLTTETEQQARDRVGGAHGHAGERAAEAALEMIALAARVRRS